MSVVNPNAFSNITYDLWLNERWVGMSDGYTPALARQRGEESLGKATMDKVIMTPFMGRGTSQATYEALMGRAPKM